MNNINGQWCPQAVGWGSADSNGVRVGIHCMLDGQECMMQCKKIDKKNLKPDPAHLPVNEISRIADSIQHLGAILKCDVPIIVAVLHDYIRLRKENKVI